MTTLRFVVEIDDLDGEPSEFVEAVKANLEKLGLELPDTTITPEGVRVRLFTDEDQLLADLVAPAAPGPADAWDTLPAGPPRGPHPTARPTPSAPRRGEPWTEEEDIQLRNEVQAGVAEAGLAAIHGRTRYAIQKRMEILGLGLTWAERSRPWAR